MEEVFKQTLSAKRVFGDVFVPVFYILSFSFKVSHVDTL